MISDLTKQTLARILKGANKLDEAQLREVLLEIQKSKVDDVLRELFEPKQKKKSSQAKPVVPAWLKSMEVAKKKISWKSPEAIDRLYIIAEANGFEPGTRKASFPSASKHIASQIGEARISASFIDWVDEYVSTHSMI